MGQISVVFQPFWVFLSVFFFFKPSKKEGRKEGGECDFIMREKSVRVFVRR